MSINNVEIQDSNGNVYYPHTDSSVVKFGNSDVGTALSEKANDTDSARTTTSKTVTGAINELNTNKKNKYDGMITDFNLALTEGEYQFNTSTVNAPVGAASAYGKVNIIVSDGTTHNNSTNWIWQIAYFTSPSSQRPQIWCRSKTNNDAWSAWCLMSYTLGGGNKIQSGSTSITLNGTNQVSGSITFPSAFSSPPMVVASLSDVGYGAAPLTTGIGTPNIYSNNFSYVVKNNNGATSTIIMCWIAIGN